MAFAFGSLASSGAAAGIYRLFAPRRLPIPALLRASALAGTAISILSLAYVVFLDVGADFEDRYVTSGLASLILPAIWLFLANALILVGYQLAHETASG